MRAVGDDRADIAAADHAERLAGDLDAHEAVLLPFAGLGRGVGLRDLRAPAPASCAMACSAVVIELPNGVFITMMPLAVAAGMSTLSTPMPARPITFRFLAFSSSFGGDLGRRADGEAVVVADDRGELLLVGAELRLEIDLDAAILEDLHGGVGECVGNENFGGHGILDLPSLEARTDGRVEVAT